MSKEGKEGKKNRWVISNVLYAFKCAWNCKKLFLAGMLLWAVTTALVGYVWQFAVKYVIEAIEKGWDAKTVIYIVVAAGIIYAALYVVEVCSAQIQEYTGSYIVYHYRRKYNRKFMAMDFEKLENPEMLDEAEKAGKGCDFGGGILIGLCHTEYFLKDLVSAIIAAVVAATLNPWLLLVFTAIGLIKAVIQVRTKEVDKRECWDKMSPYYRKLRYLGQVQSDFSFAKDVRLFNMREFLKKKHIATNAAAHKLFLGHKNRWLKWNVKNLALSLLEMALQYGYLIYAFCFGDLTIANFTLYITVMNTYTNSIRYLFDHYAELKNNSMQIDDYRNFVEEEELSLVKRPDLIPIPKSDKYVVEFKNVSFKYKGAKVYALKNVNLTLETGKSLAIVGLNGAGKTTLIKLLCRLYDVSEGEILLNGINILRFDRKEYYKLFSAVFQNVELFALSLGENVAMSERSKVDDKKAENALLDAGLKDKYESLEKGLDTQILKNIYEDGIDFSGGQKQKLALSRALYKNAPMMILDEPTAALDPIAEYELYMSFNKIVGGKLSVYISHRLSSTRFCDSIAMFKDGRLIESGTHSELLKKGGEYSQLFEVQAQYYKEREQRAADGMEEVTAYV
ncbi:MAG: ABC transporter ATP-binding protein/permease [Ruminococcus sp.]|nr:ABC transporter ATP-binding protein/permease [Ruminococcus sp.]